MDTTMNSDCATDDNVFLARSSDEVYPKHLSPDERVAFEIADAAEWKAIVDSRLGESSGLRSSQHDKEGATRQGDQQSNCEATQVVRRALFRNRKPSPDGVFWDTRILTLPTCSLTHPLHRQRAS